MIYGTIDVRKLLRDALQRPCDEHTIQVYVFSLNGVQFAVDPRDVNGIQEIVIRGRCDRTLRFISAAWLNDPENWFRAPSKFGFGSTQR